MKRYQTILLILTGVLTLAGAAGAAMSKEDIYLAFTQANDAFTRANQLADDAEQAESLYRQAIAGYEKIIDVGDIHNAKLYCNLANSYLLTEDLGRAILNYRRAERLDGSNPDVHKNLNFARSKRVDQLAVTTQKKILERLFFWHYDFSMTTRFVIGGIAFAVFCLWLTLRIWLVKWPAVLPVCGVMLCVSIAMVASVGIELHDLAAHRSGVIVAASVIARQGDGDNYPQSFNEPLHTGVEFDLIEQRPGWLHVQLPNGQKTWLPAASAELI